jgi:glycosyltransferase involved in cell wall biosynthesis
MLGLLSTGISVRGLIGSERIFPPMEKSSRLFPILRKLAFRRLDCVVGQSAKTMHWFHNELNLNFSQLAVIPNVVLSPSDEVIKSIQASFNRRRFKATNPVILCVGRLTDQKGFDFAIRILAILQKRFPYIKLLIVGDGPDILALKELVLINGLASHITFIPKLPNLSEVFLGSDILLFPSRYEGFPNVLAEAMAHGLPAVAFDCATGPADLIEHGVNGFLVEVGDVSAAAECALNLLENHGLRTQFASRAMNVANKFSAEVVGKQWSSLVEKFSLNLSRSL